jgi:predicted nucleotidyltransferase
LPDVELAIIEFVGLESLQPHRREMLALEQDLEQLLGRRVEVLTDGGPSPYLRQRILAEAAKRKFVQSDFTKLTS